MSSAGVAPLSVEDRLAITELLARYCWCFDTADVDSFVALFTPDARYELDGGRLFVGRDAIGGYLRQAAGSTWLPGRQHHVDQIVLEGTSERVTARAYCTVTHRSPDGVMSIAYLGRYADVCVKIDRQWRFHERIVRTWRSDELLAAAPSADAARG